jgi:cysteine desulfurase
MKPIYLDINATTPIDPRVADAMLPYLREHFGNPSSGHAYGVATRRAVEAARAQVAALLGCAVDEVIFTSGGSESNNTAIKGVAAAYRDRGNHVVTSAVEHPAVIEVCRYLEGQGFRVTYVEVDGAGRVDPADVEKAITTGTILVTIMHANNEVGTIQPIAEIAAIARTRGVLVHSDCAQSVGKIPVSVAELGVDLLSLAGHKLYAPKGIGALYVRAGVKLEKLMHGADHEMNQRAGTENVLEIVGLGKACELVAKEQGAQDHLRRLRDRLEQGIRERIPAAHVHGHPEHRLPNTCSIAFPGLEANTILAELDGVAASAGAACHADHVDVSAVLQAMHVPVEVAMGTIRLSVGRFTTEEEIDRAIEAIADVVGRLSPRGSRAVPAGPGVDVRLTRFTHGLGCACKLRPQVLEDVLRRLPMVEDANVLVGADASDDAAVYRLSDELAVVATVDFFTPVVDDPYDFGAIAAANSLSDVYAMGGKALFALNIVGFPSHRLSTDVLHAILRGAVDKAAEAGVHVIGGHSVDDTEPKFGMAVTGIVAPDRIVANCGARPGDVLVLTKPIGTGILATGLKQGQLDADQAGALVATMAGLNRGAAEAMQSVGVSACTDITGFGLLGHLLEMLRASRVGATISAAAVPVLEGTLSLATAGVIPGGTQDNHDFTGPSIDYDPTLSRVRRLILNDAQTSGGLLVAVSADRADALEDEMRGRGVATVARIGTIEAGDARVRVES